MSNPTSPPLHPTLLALRTTPLVTPPLQQHRSEYLGKNETSTSYISNASGTAAREIREVELEAASNARHNLRDYWKLMSGLLPAEIRQGVKIFVGGLPVFVDETEAVLQLCRIFLLEGFDIRSIQILHAPFSPAATPCRENHHFFFVDLMHEGDVDLAIRKLDGAVRLDKELMVSQVGLPNEDEIVVGPLSGYQPRRKQVNEVRKLFKGYRVGEISLFYELEAKPPSPGEKLFEDSVQQLLYFCYVRFAAFEDVDAIIKNRHQTMWAGREIFVRRPEILAKRTIVLESPLGTP